MKIMKNSLFNSITTIILTIVVGAVNAQNISINTSNDLLYLYDDFNIEGSQMTNENGSTGEGWSAPWTYQSGHRDGVGVYEGYIYNTKGGFGVTRQLSNPIKFVGSTYYVSFLFKKNSTGNFRISGRNSDDIDRFGIHIKQDGKLGAQAGVDYNNTVLSTESFVENNETYLVVAKYYYTDKPNMNISVYNANDAIPTNEPSSWNLEVEGVTTGMEAIEHFRLAFSSPTVNIDEFKLGDTWKSVSTTQFDATFPEVPTFEMVNSDVQSIDPVLTSRPKNWTFTVEEPGNYQLGYAWIWVDGTDKEVELEVKVGEEIVKSFTAKSAIAPYRFETRLENLSEGEVISVATTPKDGATYKLSYRLAYATPTFAGLPTFEVVSYGAVGDGTSNDYQAVKDACEAAESAGGGIVTFDGSKTYYVKGPMNYALFDFLNTSNIKIEGNGAKIIMHPNGNFIRMDNTENIQIDGFTTTYGPLPYFQGEITTMNVEELYLDMQVEARYEAPVTGTYRQISDMFGRSFWITIPGTKMGEGRHLSVDRTEQIGADDHAIRVFLQDHETNDLSYSKSQNATHYIIPHKDFGHSNGLRDSPYCGIQRSSRVKISNILTHSVCHFAYTIGGNYGPITFSNTDFLAPNEDDMHVVWRDGWHVWGNRYGIMIEDGDFDGGYTYDDIFSPHTNVPIVESASGTTIQLKSKPGESYKKYTDKPLWQVGDLVSFWDENQTVYFGMARIKNVATTGSLSRIDITLDREIEQAQAGAYVINEEIINRDMVIRNCTTTPKGRNVAVRQRTPILYQNCDFQNIHFWTYIGEPWRTRPRNVVFDNCIIYEGNKFNVDDAWNLTIKNSTIKTNPIDISNCPRLILDNSTAVNLILKDNSRAYVFGDGNNGNQSYNKDVSSEINFSKPNVYPSYRPPFLVDIEESEDSVYAKEPFDVNSTTLTDAGSGIGWKDNWTSSDAGLSIDEEVSLIYPSGVALNTSGGHIVETQSNVSNERLFENQLSLASGTFYLSFLAKKTADGFFKLETSNTSSQIRFGMSVAGTGSITAKSGTGISQSNRGKFESNKTYLVVVKYSNQSGNSAVTRVKLYKEGDLVPMDDTDLVWDVESAPNSTGVIQDRLLIKVEGGTVALDELIIGNSFRSVTYDENFEEINLAVAMDENIKAKLYPNPATTHFTVDLSSITKADLKLFDLTGKMVMSKTNVTGQIMIPVNTLENGIYILNVKTESGSYMQKILIIPEL